MNGTTIFLILRNYYYNMSQAIPSPTVQISNYSHPIMKKTAFLLLLVVQTICNCRAQDTVYLGSDSVYMTPPSIRDSCDYYYYYYQNQTACYFSSDTHNWRGSHPPWFTDLLFRFTICDLRGLGILIQTGAMTDGKTEKVIVH